MKRQWVIVCSGLLVIGLVSNAKAARHYGGELCAYEEFHCVKVKRGDTWVKLFPNERERKIVKRLNRINLPLRNRPWIVVPTDFTDLSYLDVSPFERQLDEEGSKQKIVIDLSDQAFGAYNDAGELVHWGPISGGKGFCTDTMEYCRTVTGNYKIFRKQGVECVSSKFPLETEGGAPMPYCMHFFRGFALHGAALPGRHASHGCVRLFHADAKWLNQSFAKIGTPVIIRH